MATAPKTPDAAKAAAPTKVAAITVTSRSPQGTFRRAGRAWPAEPTTVAVSEFNAEQLKALRDEPLLVVQDTKLEVASAAADAGTDQTAE